MLLAALPLTALSFATLAVASPAAAPAPTITARAEHKALQGRAAAASPSPLTAYTYAALSDVPYQVNPYPVGRGPQSGYNQCNSTTAGDNSQCQTLIFNNLTDFCLWGSPTPNGLIGDIEAAVVAYCTTNDHGARVIPAGAITGVQLTRTSAYLQIVGFIDQTKLGLVADDTGGELDPHGADLLGNPLGGLAFSSGLPKHNGTLIQANNWNMFIGSGYFCTKFCDPSVTSPDYCQNTLDLIGCDYNMPSAAQNGTFTECDGDLQDVVGVYTENGQVLTWSQPATLPDDYSMPYTPRVPASSNCKTYSSEQLYATVPASSATTTSGASAATNSLAGANTGSSSGSGVAAASTGTAAAAAKTSAAASGAVSLTSFGAGLAWLATALTAVVATAFVL